MAAIRRNRTFLFFFAACLLFFLTGEAKAQRHLALHWDIPRNQNEALRQLDRIRDLGFTTLEIEQLPQEEIWNRIEEHGFAVYGIIPIRYPVIQNFAEPDSQTVAAIEKYANYYLRYSSVTALRLFEYGQITRPRFLEVLSPFVEQLKQTREAGITIYAKTSRLQPIALPPLDSYVYELNIDATNYDRLTVPEPTGRIAGFYYRPSEKIAGLVTPLKNVIDATSAHRDLPLIFDSHRLFSLLDRYPGLSEIFAEVSSDTDPVFPLPNETIPDEEQSTTIPLILLVIWGSFALHYSGSPLYRKSLTRYFTSHSFFVDDIYRRHIRSLLPAFIILIQNALLLAISVYICFESLFGQSGKEALFYHYKWLSFFGNSRVSVFLLTFTLTLLLSFLLILWLYFTNRSVTNISQVATLYSWPLQLNLIITTVLVPVYMGGGGAFAVTVLTFFALFIFLAGFILAALDTARFMRSRKGLFLVGTAGIYIMSLTAAVISLSVSDGFTQIISLALSLSY